MLGKNLPQHRVYDVSNSMREASSMRATLYSHLKTIGKYLVLPVGGDAGSRTRVLTTFISASTCLVQFYSEKDILVESSKSHSKHEYSTRD